MFKPTRLLSSNYAKFKINKNCAIIELNRPDKLNVINLATVKAIRNQVDIWVEKIRAKTKNVEKFPENDIKFLLFKSSNLSTSKAFSAGGDVREMVSGGREDPKIGKDFMFFEYKLDYKLATLEQALPDSTSNLFQISIYNGIVMGGGAGISINSKYRIVTEKTIFSMPEVSIGFFPDVGSSWFLNEFCRKNGQKNGISKYFGIFLGLTGTRITGYDNYLFGIGTHFINSNQLAEVIFKIENAENEEKVLEILNFYCEDSNMTKNSFFPKIWTK